MTFYEWWDSKDTVLPSNPRELAKMAWDAALASRADVSRDSVLEEAALIADRRSYGPDDREAGAAAGIADEIRSLKRQSNSPRSDK